MCVTPAARVAPSHGSHQHRLRSANAVFRNFQARRLYWDAMATHMEIVLQAAAFAADKHRYQRRKDEEASPYINHPIQLAYILVQADVEDPVVLASALLHDTIEDTN